MLPRIAMTLCALLLGTIASRDAGAEGKPPAAASGGCTDLTDFSKCTDRVSSNEGKSHAWKVTKAGAFSVTVTPTGTNAVAKLWPRVTVTGAKGAALGEGRSKGGDPVSVTFCAAAGSNEIHVGDVDPAHIGQLKGGAGYTLDIAPAADHACAGGCADMSDAVACSDRFFQDAGKDHEWRVTKPGAYVVTVTSLGKSALFRLWADLAVDRGPGKPLAHAAASDGAPSVSVTVCAEKGPIHIRLKDVDPTRVSKMKGGVGYAIDVKAGDSSKCPKK